MEFCLNSFYTISRRRVNFMFPQMQYFPSILPVVMVFHPVFLLDIGQAVPVIPIAFNDQFFVGESEISHERTYNILGFRCHSCLIKSFSHQEFNAAYFGHVQCCPDPSTFSRTKTKSFQFVRRDIFQFPANLALNGYFWFSFCIVCAFVTAIVSFVGAFLYESLVALWAYSCSRCFVFCFFPFTSACIAAPCWIVFTSPSWNAKRFVALFADVFVPFAFCDIAAIVTAIFCMSIDRGFKRFAANRTNTYFCFFLSLLVARFTAIQSIATFISKEFFVTLMTIMRCEFCGKMIGHGNLSFLCHASGSSSYAGAKRCFVELKLYHRLACKAIGVNHDSDWGSSVYQKSAKDVNS